MDPIHDLAHSPKKTRCPSMMIRISTSMAAMLLAQTAFADPPEIEAVSVSSSRINVTVRHPDTGWDHYADVWRVYLPDGTLLAERVLLHPHETEQPFTRSTEITVPDGVTELTVIAGCSDGDLSEPFVVSVGG